MERLHTWPAFRGRIGVAREDITPPQGIYAKNWGAATHDVAEGVHRPLTVTVLTLQPDEQEAENAPFPLVLASLDLGWWRTREDEWFLRGGVIDALGLDARGVLLALTHTHSGPAICQEDADQPGGHLIAPYMERVRDAVIHAVRQALNTAQPATLTVAQGVCDLATNRDLPDPEWERYVCGYFPDGPADTTLLVGRVTADNGQSIATLVNYACHPTTLGWENRKISPDFVGAMREVVEAHTGGAPCLFLQGASGELAPREQYTADTAIADAHGQHLGFAVLATLAGMPPNGQGMAYAGVVESGAPLGIWRRVHYPPARALRAVQAELPLRLKVLPSLDAITAMLQQSVEPFAVERARRMLRVRRMVGEGTAVPVPFWVWQAGEAFFVGHPAEAYSLFQVALRQRFPRNAIFALNVVNGHYGYLPPEALFSRDLYAVWQTPFAPGCLEDAVEFCASLIRGMSEVGT
ncbi:MAG: neutral/alkaline non-lysosomal ceramidase N-terminal domain-containing protein [Chloroherpetonaceae bacterium]|nr:neutral/alkaline non-lysosomal ceramidase N-terminal domain-containing protein [Chthonomonadaceae bacterium]MDW8207129.1 neutral/alkaline non-lysosomal ceramidase N-terminal domain-containing protein [Chloroherpetonaceae bacterium]